MRAILSGDVEAGIADLEAAGLIDASSRLFRFVKETGTVGNDYDIGMEWGNIKMSVENKVQIGGRGINGKLGSQHARQSA